VKIYFVCDGRPDWYSCWGVLENGFVFGQHVCSHPFYAPNDLYFRRDKRVAALRTLFGITPGTVEPETIVVASKADIPAWWGGLEEKQRELEHEYARYRDLLGGEDTRCKIDVEVMDESDQGGEPK
jgi:hypothetical protein